MRRLPIVALTVLVAALAGPAGAQTTVLDRAAPELRRSSVYVDPSAERKISDAAAQDLKNRIANGHSPIFIAVLPAEAVSEVGGDAGQLPSVLARKVGLQGTYAVVSGSSFRAGSNVMAAGRAGALATSSFQAKSSAGTEAVLATFVDRVNQTVPDGGAAQASGDDVGGGGDTGSGGTSGAGSGGLLLLLAAGGGGLYLWSRSRRRRTAQQDQRELAADRQMIQADLSVLGDDVLALEPEVTMHPDARPDYDAGVTRFKSAQAALEYADGPVDLVRVQRVVDEGRYAMDRARARVEGREPPAPPEPLRRPGRRNEPALDVDERGAPVYVGYGGMPWYGGGGWFGGGGGGGGGLITGLLLGEMLGGGGWGGGGWGGGGWGGGYNGPGDDSGGNDGGDGADVGGGDWGGGDFGGGDFGGGDFGGDAGGGDW